MSEETNNKPASVSPEPSTEPESSKIFGVPVEVFVRGGTSTTANDKRVAELKADAIKRRAEADEERRIANVPIEDGGGKMFTNKLTDRPDVEQSYVELAFVNSKGEPIYDCGEEVKCLADLVVLSKDELAIIMVCPRCFGKGMPLDQCQIRIRQSNKRFEIDHSKAGTPIFWCEGNDAQGKKIIKVYRSAGVIRESEHFTCDCGWSARIANNKIIPG